MYSYDPIWDDMPGGEEDEEDYNPGNPDAADAMSIAADYRREGYSASDALKKGWDEVLGEGGFMKADWNRYLMYGGAAYGLWVLVSYFQTKVWNFTPWKSIASNRVAPARMIAPANPGTNVGTRPTPPGNYKGYELILPAHGTGYDQRESVGIIYP
jgi:hypothetical protein